MTPVISGQCTCAKLRITSSAVPVLQLVCHCQDCRDATKQDYCVTAFFKIKDCKITGATIVQSFKTKGATRTTRESCPECGSVLFDKSERFPHLIGVFTEHLTPPFVSTPTSQVWTSSRLAHVTAYPNLKEYPNGLT